MPSEPAIIPPVPTITQPSGPVDDSPGLEEVQRAFDRAYPWKGESPKPSTPEPTQQPPETPSEPIAPTEAPPETAPEAPVPEPKAAPEHKLPSFLEESLKVNVSQAPPAAPAADEFPEELPTFKSSEESKTNWKRLRENYQRLKEENKKLSSRPALDEAAAARLQTLETHNKQMSETLTRFGVEQSAEFQQNVIRPLQASWYEAARIVQESGRDPQDLARAMSQKGKAQFEALDELFEGMPESAKAEAHDAIRSYRRFEDVRQQALAKAPQTFQEIRKRELEREYQSVNQQRAEMANMFTDAIRTLRDDAKVEVFRTTNEPEAAWWNDQAKAVEDQGRQLYLDNTDMKRMAYACALAPLADVYRKLWLTERAAKQKVEGTLKDRFGAEPSLSESSGGSDHSPPAQMAADLKRPFSEVFLREFHRAQAGNR